MRERLPDQEANIALLIDADNASPDHLDEVLLVLGELGTINVRRAYGNWAKASLKGWGQLTGAHSIVPMQQFDVVKGKSATDMRMTIDAMDLLYRGNVDGFVIVSSDSDFLPLALSGVGTAEQVRGRFADAEVAADEGLRLARETGQRIAEGLNLTTLAAVAAFRGEEDRCREYAHTALTLAIPRRFNLAAASVAWILAFLELGLGQAAAALPRLQALTEGGSGSGHFLINLYSLPDRIVVGELTNYPERARARFDPPGFELRRARWSGDQLAGALGLLDGNERRDALGQALSPRQGSLRDSLPSYALTFVSLRLHNFCDVPFGDQ